MERQLNRTAAALGVVLLGVLSGCGDDKPPPYPEATACGADTSRVAEIVGTDRFTVGGDRLDDLPLPLGNRFYQCDIVLDDPTSALRVVLKTDPAAADTVRGLIDRGESFGVADGVGRGSVTPFDEARPESLTARWACGAVSGDLEAIVETWSADAARSLVDDIATAVGCVSRPVP